MNFKFDNVSKWKWIKSENGESRKLTILQNISVNSCGEKIHVILGPSGSGKTTLLRLLNKLETPDVGAIFIDDENIADFSPREFRRDIGMVFQIPALFEGTVEDNILFGPRLNIANKDRGDVLELLKIVDLESIEPTRSVANLSVGQQQRISFARALANDPKVLLLDEPTSALDPTTARKLLEIIRKINQEIGIDIIMVTHILPHAENIADSVCLLVNGKVVETSPAREFFKSPHTEFGQKFICGEL